MFFVFNQHKTYFQKKNFNSNKYFIWIEFDFEQSEYNEMRPSDLSSVSTMIASHANYVFTDASHLFEKSVLNCMTFFEMSFAYESHVRKIGIFLHFFFAMCSARELCVTFKFSKTFVSSGEGCETVHGTQYIRTLLSFW